MGLSISITVAPCVHPAVLLHSSVYPCSAYCSHYGEKKGTFISLLFYCIVLLFSQSYNLEYLGYSLSQRTVKYQVSHVHIVLSICSQISPVLICLHSTQTSCSRNNITNYLISLEIFYPFSSIYCTIL